ncbi:hypothetical protein DIPPA_05646 [Diplonema papillatum]|nr:hypothetical protein DIPPA_05646 [Diplonema papillatum]
MGDDKAAPGALREFMASLKTVFIDNGREAEGSNSFSNVDELLQYAARKATPAAPPAAGRQGLPQSRRQRNEKLFQQLLGQDPLAPSADSSSDSEESTPEDAALFEEFVALNKKLRQANGSDPRVLEELAFWRRRWAGAFAQQGIDGRGSLDGAQLTIPPPPKKGEFWHKGSSRRWRWVPLQGRHDAVPPTTQQAAPQHARRSRRASEEDTSSARFLQKVSDLLKKRGTTTRGAVAVSQAYHALVRQDAECIRDHSESYITPDARMPACSICESPSFCLNCCVIRRQNPLIEGMPYNALNDSICATLREIHDEEQALWLRCSETFPDGGDELQQQARAAFDDVVKTQPWAAWLYQKDHQLATLSVEHEEALQRRDAEHSLALESLRKVVQNIRAENITLAQRLHRADELEAELAEARQECARGEAAADRLQEQLAAAEAAARAAQKADASAQTDAEADPPAPPAAEDPLAEEEKRLKVSHTKYAIALFEAYMRFAMGIAVRVVKNGCTKGIQPCLKAFAAFGTKQWVEDDHDAGAAGGEVERPRHKNAWSNGEEHDMRGRLLCARMWGRVAALVKQLFAALESSGGGVPPAPPQQQPPAAADPPDQPVAEQATPSPPMSPFYHIDDIPDAIDVDSDIMSSHADSPRRAPRPVLRRASAFPPDSPITPYETFRHASRETADSGSRLTQRGDPPHEPLPSDSAVRGKPPEDTHMAQPAAPTQPAVPDQAVVLTQPIVPTQPGVPIQSAVPIEPAVPDQAVVPSQPAVFPPHEGSVGSTAPGDQRPGPPRPHGRIPLRSSLPLIKRKPSAAARAAGSGRKPRAQSVGLDASCSSNDNGNGSSFNNPLPADLIDQQRQHRSMRSWRSSQAAHIALRRSSQKSVSSTT